MRVARQGVIPGKLLICDECGCMSDKQAKGWAAFLGLELDRRQPPSVCIFCPVCAAEQFGYRPSTASDSNT